MYNFKAVQELAWAVAIAVGVYVAQLLMEFEVEAVEDWQLYASAAVAGALRVIGGVVLSKARPSAGVE